MKCHVCRYVQKCFMNHDDEINFSHKEEDWIKKRFKNKHIYSLQGALDHIGMDVCMYMVLKKKVEMLCKWEVTEHKLQDDSLWFDLSWWKNWNIKP